MRIAFILLLFLSVSVAAAQAEVEVKGSGETGTIIYGETITEELEVSDASSIGPISFVGHNGANRSQGDFDAWYFDAHKGDNVIIRMTADGDFTPTLLITMKSPDFAIILVTAWDSNPDGDSEAGVCLTNIQRDEQYAVLAYRQEDVPAKYSLSLEKVDSVADLSGGSETAVCGVGSNVISRGDNVINIRSNPGTNFSIKSKMQPGQPYTLFSTGEAWTHILFHAENGITDGYVSTSLIRITGTVEDADETPEPSG
jgi:hypothetical protein